MCSNISSNDIAFRFVSPGTQLLTEAQWTELSQCFQFSQRERDVCRMLFEGKTRNETATKLGIKPRTVRDYMEKIHAKFGVCNRVGVALRVIQVRDHFAALNADQN